MMFLVGTFQQSHVLCNSSFTAAPVETASLFYSVF